MDMDPAADIFAPTHEKIRRFMTDVEKAPASQRDNLINLLNTMLDTANSLLQNSSDDTSSLKEPDNSWMDDIDKVQIWNTFHIEKWISQAYSILESNIEVRWQTIALRTLNAHALDVFHAAYHPGLSFARFVTTLRLVMYMSLPASPSGTDKKFADWFRSKLPIRYVDSADGTRLDMYEHFKTPRMLMRADHSPVRRRMFWNGNIKYDSDSSDSDCRDNGWRILSSYRIRSNGNNGYSRDPHDPYVPDRRRRSPSPRRAADQPSRTSNADKDPCIACGVVHNDCPEKDRHTRHNSLWRRTRRRSSSTHRQ